LSPPLTVPSFFSLVFHPVLDQPVKKEVFYPRFQLSCLIKDKNDQQPNQNFLQVTKASV
jgi:hypothetical protein